jgi:ABC-type multidrug transport system permease subunit
MKPLSKKGKIVVGWTALMTVIGTAILHQWQFFALGIASIALLLIANQYGLLKDTEDKK